MSWPGCERTHQSKFWEHDGAFDSAAACETSKTELLGRQAKQEPWKGLSEGLQDGVYRVHRARTLALLWAECLASDDSRLK